MTRRLGVTVRCGASVTTMRAVRVTGVVMRQMALGGGAWVTLLRPLGVCRLFPLFDGVRAMHGETATLCEAHNACLLRACWALLALFAVT